MAHDDLSDDPSIVDDASLWRRIHPSWVVRDDNIDGPRVSSAAFDNSQDGSPTSIFIADLVRQTGRDTSDLLGGFEDYALASILAGDARQCGQGVKPDPLPEEPAHGLIVGNKNKRTKRCLAQHADWVILPSS